MQTAFIMTAFSWSLAAASDLITGRIPNAIFLLRLAHAARAHPTINLDNPAALRILYGVAIAAGAFYPVLVYVISR